jgi:hypothetical protein
VASVTPDNQTHPDNVWACLAVWPVRSGKTTPTNTDTPLKGCRVCRGVWRTEPDETGEERMLWLMSLAATEGSGAPGYSFRRRALPLCDRYEDH